MDHNHAYHPSDVRLAFSATVHCLTGCGIGEVWGVILGLLLELSALFSIILGIILGFLFGFLLGIIPLVRAGKTLQESFRIIFISEFISISVMEATEVAIQIYTPWVMDAGLMSLLFWWWMLLALVWSFIVTYPINYILIKKGIRHSH